MTIHCKSVQLARARCVECVCFEWVEVHNMQILNKQLLSCFPAELGPRFCRWPRNHARGKLAYRKHGCNHWRFNCCR